MAGTSRGEFGRRDDTKWLRLYTQEMLSRFYRYIRDERPDRDTENKPEMLATSTNPPPTKPPEQNGTEEGFDGSQLEPINAEEVLDQDMGEAQDIEPAQDINVQMDQMIQDFEGESLIIDEAKSTPIQYGTTFEQAVDFTSDNSFKTIKLNSNLDILSGLETNQPNEYEWKINLFYLPKLNKYYQLNRDQDLLNYNLHNKYTIDEKLQEIETEKLEKVSLIKPLIPQQMARVRQIVSDTNVSRVVISNYQIDLTVRDLQTLRPAQWLNDNIIDFYFNMISEQNPQYFSWTSHFYTTLKARGYSGVQRWGKRKKLNLFEKSLVFIPINISSTHWALATIDNKAKTLAYYDSLNALNTNSEEEEERIARFPGLELIKTYMKGEVGRLQLGNTVDVDSYELLDQIKVPQQQNGFDCGVFTCVCAYYLSTHKPLTYSQKDIPTFRARMIYELIQDKLLEQ